MRIAIDTNCYQAFCRAEKLIVDLVRQSEEIIMPFIVLTELKAGFRSGSRSLSNERFLSRFLNSTRVNLVFADQETVLRYSEIFAQLRKIGRPIPTNDIWIAAIALQNNVPLLTKDKDFNSIVQLDRVL